MSHSTQPPDRPPAGSLSLFLCGDVMTGRGIDQALPHPCHPALHEPYVRDARRYVELAEGINGPIPRPLKFGDIWGDALDELEQVKPDVRIINLETSITTSDEFWRGKDIHYRMHPLNIGCLTAANIDCCCLANNHVLDWGYAGLWETLQTLDAVGLQHPGAGNNAVQSAAPAIFDIQGKGRVLVFAYGSRTSGVPDEWAAAAARPGVNLLDDFSERTAQRILAEMKLGTRPGDVLVASIHWGSNWGYEVPEEQEHFAHWLIDGGVAVVHGHSSHHTRPIEIRQGRLILYGCGDFINDYEGIGGYEAFRGDLTLMIFATIDPVQNRVLEVRLVPLQMRRFRLNRATAADARWLGDLVNRLGKPSGTQAKLQADNSLILAGQ